MISRKVNAHAGTVTAVLALASLALAGNGAGRAQALASTVAGSPAPGTISTVAGGAGGPARATRVSIEPQGVSFSGGNLYVADAADGVVRDVSPATDRMTTVAGSGLGGAPGNGGAAVKAGLNAAATVTDGSGNLVIADATGNRIRVVAGSTGTFYGQSMIHGRIYLVAGAHRRGYSGDGGPALNAEMDAPISVAVAPAGNLAVADEGNNRVRVVAQATGTFYGTAMSTGDIYTVAGNGSRGFSGDGGPATSAGLAAPSGVAVDSAGNLIISDSRDSPIRLVAATAGTFYGQAMTAGHIYTIAGDGDPGYSGDGGPATSAELDSPGDATLDSVGNVIIADTDNERIRVLAENTGTFYDQAMTKGDIYTIAGNGSEGFSGDRGPATSARFNEPESVTTDASGNLIIGDLFNDRARLVAESTGTFYGQAMTAGDIYTIAGHSGTSLLCCTGLPATAGQTPGLATVTTDQAGNMIIGVWNEVEVAAAATGTFYGQHMTAGDLYDIAGNNKFGFSGDGGPATSATMEDPGGLAVDAAGNVIISDTLANRIRLVAVSTGTFYGQAMTAGDIYTIAGDGATGFSGDGGPATSAELDQPGTMTVDAAGNVVFADALNNRIRVIAATSGTFYGQVMTSGDIYTIAGSGEGFSGDGGPATSAELDFPNGVTLDSAGNVIIGDTFNQRIRVVAVSTGTFYGQAMTKGDIYTVAGNGTQGGSGDGGPATSAELGSPWAVAVDSAGNLILTDTLHPQVQVVAASTGTFYGHAMTKGDIYTIAGNGTGGHSGDGGPATSAELDDPVSLAVTGAGSVLIADQANENEGISRVRMVQG